MKQNRECYYIQISSGRGPVECCWVVAQVLKSLLNEIIQLGFSVEEVHRTKGSEAGTVSSCILRIEGRLVKEALSPWLGTIQWIGKSSFRKYHKRKNWFVGVSLYPVVSHVKFDERDVVYQSFRSSGPGGQHRNKVETAMRVTHKPSGLMATATDSKSQLQNKKAALEKMKQLLDQYELDLLQKQVDDQWKDHLSLVRGNPVKVFEGRDFKFVK